MVRINSNGVKIDYEGKIQNLRKETLNDHEVAKKIREKAKELRGAGGESEMLIIAEQMQVDKGYITEDEKIKEIEDRFDKLSKYKLEVLEEYSKKKE